MYNVTATFKHQDQANRFYQYLNGANVDRRSNFKVVVTGSVSSDAHLSTFLILIGTELTSGEVAHLTIVPTETH